jgi:Na+-driven multidrug efflux pump
MRFGVLSHALHTHTCFSASKDTAIRRNIDTEFATIFGPALVALAADPLASLVDSGYLGRLQPSDMAGAGLALSAQYSISKLYNGVEHAYIPLHCVHAETLYVH